jgi:hypothetical protein
MARERPWLFKRAPAISVALATLGLGIGQIVWSARVNAENPWLGGLLVNTGTATALFAPLLMLTQLFERRLARSERQTTSQVEDLAQEIASVRQGVAAALEALSGAAVTRLAAERAPDLRTIDDLKEHPTRLGVARALALGEKFRITSSRGPRVRIFDTSLYARWTLQDPAEPDISHVLVTIEDVDGSLFSTIPWIGEQTAEDLAVEIGRLLQRNDQYPGDIAYHPGLMFAELHRLLELGYRTKTGANGLVEDLGRLVELVRDQWAITDTGITAIDGRHYRISLQRLNEINWDAHMRDKPWVDIAAFRYAFETAASLVAQGHLDATPPESPSRASD